MCLNFRILSFFLKLFIPIALTAMLGCSMGFESSDLSASDAANARRFADAKTVIDRNCVGCHDGSGNTRSLDLSDASDFINSGLVVPGRVDLSSLAFRLRNFNDTSPTGSDLTMQNMPPSGPISQSDYALIVDWITNLPVQNNLACGPNENLLKPIIRRLTLEQYQNSVETVFGSIFNNTHFPQNLNDANPRIGLSNDPEILTINETNILDLNTSASRVADHALQNISVLQNCQNASNITCFTTIAQEYGFELWRRPLSNTEVQGYNQRVASLLNGGVVRADIIRFVLNSLIISPNHMFRTELGPGSVPNTGTIELTPYETASFLSFSLWNRPPDQRLYELAASNEINNIGVLRQEANRMLQSSLVSDKISSFFVDLLKIKDVETAPKSNNYPISATERQALYESAQRGLSSVYQSTDTDFFEAFHSFHYHVNNSSARFFNQNAGAFNSTFRDTNLPRSERYGVMSHPAFLTGMSGENGTGIVKRGVFTLEQLLCYKMGNVPAETNGVGELPPGFNPEMASAREVLQVTHSAQPTCIGCHQLIDPAGFGYENFDPLGRFRTTERGSIPIDSSGRISNIVSESIVFNDSTSFFRELASNSECQSCIKKNLVHYVMGQKADKGPGQCEYNNLENRLSDQDNSIGSIIRGYFELDSITTRRAE